MAVVTVTTGVHLLMKRASCASVTGHIFYVIGLRVKNTNHASRNTFHSQKTKHLPNKQFGILKRFLNTRTWFKKFFKKCFEKPKICGLLKYKTVLRVHKFLFLKRYL